MSLKSNSGCRFFEPPFDVILYASTNIIIHIHVLVVLFISNCKSILVMKLYSQVCDIVYHDWMTSKKTKES